MFRRLSSLTGSPMTRSPLSLLSNGRGRYGWKPRIAPPLIGSNGSVTAGSSFIAGGPVKPTASAHKSHWEVTTSVKKSVFIMHRAIFPRRLSFTG